MRVVVHLEEARHRRQTVNADHVGHLASSSSAVAIDNTDHDYITVVDLLQNMADNGGGGGNGDGEEATEGPRGCGAF